MASDVSDAAVEAAKLAWKLGSAAADVVTFMTESSDELPLLQPALGTLAIIREKVETVQSIPEECAALGERCTYLTACVIVKCRRVSAGFDVAPLDDCLREVAKFVERCGRRGRVSRVLKASHDKAEIARFNASLDRLAGDLGLAGIATVEQKVDTILARLQAGPKLAAVPKGVPMGESWHTTREGAMDRVCDILGDDGPPTLAALTGRSGSGKTTAAAAMVGERGPIRPRAGETEDQARTRLDCVRALFPDGVVWLRVGKGEGAVDRLPALMRKLAKAFHENVMKMSVRSPVLDEDGDSYVNAIVSQEYLRCLVVADDVWESDVVEKLRKTGMWVLVTTRDVSIVEPDEVVVLDELTPKEAAGVLRGAARLPMDERLNDDAAKILEICGHVAMDIAFVGSWSSVRTGDDGVLKSRGAWADATRQIETEISAVKGLASAAGTMADVAVSRLAVLRAGLKHLGAEHLSAQELYLALGVLPSGYAFETSAAAVVLNDDVGLGDHHFQVAMAAVATLERWAVLRADTSGLYRMHDAHADFAREALMDRGDIRKPAIRRWTSHVSRPKALVNMDLYTLLGLWRALERVGGDEWWASKAYEDHLLGTSSHPLKFHEVAVVAELYLHDKFTEPAELALLMRRVLEDCQLMGEAETGVKMVALWYLGEALLNQGLVEKYFEVIRELGQLTMKDPWLPGCSANASSAQMATIFNIHGFCASRTGWLEDALEWFHKAQSAQKEGDVEPSSWGSTTALYGLASCMRESGRPQEAEVLVERAMKVLTAKLGEDHLMIAWTLDELARCARASGRPGRAEELYKRVLVIVEAKLGPDNISVASGLCELGGCARELGRPAEAEELLTRALGIQTAKLEQDNLLHALTLHELGICMRELGRPGEGEQVLRRALSIRAEKLGPDGNLAVAFTLHELGRCVWEQQRLEEAAAFFRRALDIKTAKLPQDDIQVAFTLQLLGRCMREAGRPAEAERFITRALSINEEKLGPEEVQVAVALQDLGRCVQAAGRPGEAQGLFRRSVKILEAKLGGDDVQVAFLLDGLGQCLMEAGEAPKAEQALKRALDIKEAALELYIDKRPSGGEERPPTPAVETKQGKPGVSNEQIAVTLYKLGRCLRDLGRSEEAEKFVKRALDITREEFGLEDERVALALQHLGQCLVAKGRPEEAEAHFVRALEIKEATSGSDDLQTAVALYELGKCVRKAGRPGAAVEHLKRALKIEEATLGGEDLQVSATLRELGLCLREAGRPADAEGMLKKALGIKEAHLGLNNKEVAATLHELGRCVRLAGRAAEAESVMKRALQTKEAILGVCLREVGRPVDAEAVLKRALEIEEAKLEGDDDQIAVTLHDLGLTLRDAGRPAEGERFLERASRIVETKLHRGAQEMNLACVLHDLGRCARQAGRPEDAVGVLKRALAIKEMCLGPLEIQVSVTLYELALCARAAGQPGEAADFLKRVLQIEEAKLPPDDVQIGATLQELGRCVWEAGGREDTGVFFERALGIAERNLGSDNLQVAVLVHELGLSRRAESRHGESVKLLKRALQIKQAYLGRFDLEVAGTLKELGCCLREAGRMKEAQLFLKRAVEVKAAKLGPGHPEIDVLRRELTLCVQEARPARGLIRTNLFFLVFVRFLLTV